MFEPEYVNIFGVPFTFLPHESNENGIPPATTSPRRPSSRLLTRRSSRLAGRISSASSTSTSPHLALDWDKVEPLALNASETAQVAELAPVVDGKPDFSKISDIDLEQLAREYRTQKIIFEAARRVYDQMQVSWRGSRHFHIAQLVYLVERFIRSDKIRITPALFHQDASEPASHHHPEHDQSGAAYLGGDSLREYRAAGAGVRPGPSHFAPLPT